MNRLRMLTAEELHKALLSLGFQPLRQKGSHVFLRHPDGRGAVIPRHNPHAEIGRGLLRKVLHDAHVRYDEIETRL